MTLSSSSAFKVVDDGKSLVILFENFLSNKDANILYRSLYKASSWMKLPKRDAMWIGNLAYNYTGVHHKENTEWQSELSATRDSLNVRFSADINSVLCNRYKGCLNWIPFHADDEDILGPEPTIFSISIGHPRVFTMLHKVTNHKIECKLDSGSLLIMCGETQLHWLHAVLQDSQVTEGRINLTFRKCFDHSWILTSPRVPHELKHNSAFGASPRGYSCKYYIFYCYLYCEN